MPEFETTAYKPFGFGDLLGFKKQLFKPSDILNSHEGNRMAEEIVAMDEGHHEMLMTRETGELGLILDYAHRDTRTLMGTTNYFVSRLLADLQSQTVPSYMLGSEESAPMIIAGPVFKRHLTFVDKAGILFQTALSKSLFSSKEWLGIYSISNVLSMFGPAQKSMTRGHHRRAPKVSRTSEYYGDVYKFDGLSHHKDMNITIDKPEKKIRIYTGSSFIDIIPGTDQTIFEISVLSNNPNGNEDVPYELVASSSVNTRELFPSLRELKTEEVHDQVVGSVIDFVIDDLEECLGRFINGKKINKGKSLKANGREKEGKEPSLFTPEDEISFPIADLYLTDDTGIAGGAQGGYSSKQVFEELELNQGRENNFIQVKVDVTRLPKDVPLIFVDGDGNLIYQEIQLPDTGGRVRRLIPNQGANLMQCSRAELDLVARLILGAGSLKGVSQGAGNAVVAAVRKFALFNGESHAAQYGTETTQTTRRLVSSALTKLRGSGHKRNVAVLSLQNYESKGLILLVAKKSDYA